MFNMQCNKDVTPVRLDWSYVLFALTHLYEIMNSQKHPVRVLKSTDVKSEWS